MIRVERGEEVSPGVFAYRIPSLQISGKSRQPLLDACRQIKSILGETGDTYAAIYREGRLDPDATCSVKWGAAHTVHERGRGIRFVRYRPFGEKLGKAAE